MAGDPSVGERARPLRAVDAHERQGWWYFAPGRIERVACVVACTSPSRRIEVDEFDEIYLDLGGEA